MELLIGDRVGDADGVPCLAVRIDWQSFPYIAGTSMRP